MKNEFLSRVKKVSVFIFGGIILSLGTSVILYEPLGNYLNQLSENELEQLKANPFDEITEASFKIFLIAYLLFNQLPEKIKRAHWLTRVIYFLLFYLFCYMIYLWI